MKCPHCQHSAKEPPKMKCSHCGQIYERAQIEEFQNLAFLHKWITNQGDRLGDQAESLLEEVESRQNELRSLIGIQIRPAEQVARELALTKGAISRVTSWRKAVHSRFAPTKELNQHLEQRIIYLQAELGERSFDLDAPKYLDVINFTLGSTQAWKNAGYLTDNLATSLIRFLQNERDARVSILSEKYTQGLAVLRLIPDWNKSGVIGTDFSESLKTYLSRQVKVIAAELRDPPEDSLSLLTSIELALQALTGWEENPKIICQKDEVQTLKAHLQEQRAAEETLIAAEAAKALRKPVPQPEPIKTTVTPTPIPTPVKAAAKPAAIQAPAKPKPKPVSPPKPKKPPIDWGKVWEKVVQAAISGAFLRGLLYLGAFMIVVSLGILVIRFWDIFPAPVQAIFIFSVPTIFYIAGWFVGGKLKLPQAGGVLTGIGALLIAVDFAAIYQFGGLSLNPIYYWLATSVVCTLAYILTAWRMKGVFFDYIALIGGASVVLALMFTLELPLHWTIASMTAYALAMVVAASQLWSGGDAWRDTARATRYLPQLVIPISLISILFLSWETGSAAISTAFLLSALSYSLLVRRFQVTIFYYLAVGCSIGAIGFGLWALGLQLDWYAVAAAAVSTPYVLIARRLGIHFSKDKPAWEENWLPFMLAGIGLLITALLTGLITLFFTYWAGVLALTLISIILASWAYIFRRPILIAVSSAFFLVPFSLAASRWLIDAQILQWGAWLMAAWAGLAIIYMVAAVLLKRIRHYVVWYLLWAQLLAPVSIFGLYIHHTITSSIPSNIPTLVALGGVILFYLLSAIFHDSGRNRILSTYVLRILPGQLGKSAFMWPLAVLISIWIAIAWHETSLPQAWLGAALAATGLVYVLLGHYAYRSKTAYRLPWHVWAYVLAAAGVAVAYPERTALASALYIDVILLVAFALVYRRYWEIGMAAALFIWPFQLTLTLTPIEFHAYSLAYALLASLGYIPVGIWLRRFGRKFAATHYFIGYAMSVIAAAASLISVFDIYPVEVPSIGLVVLLITSALYIFSLYHFKKSVFAWASALTIALAFWQVLVLLQVPFDFYSVAWIGFGIAYMLVERFLHSTSVQWIQSFRIPLGLSAVALWLFGLALTALPTINALNGLEINSGFPVISAQLLALSFLFIAAKLYSTKWPLFLEPILAFFPVTLFFIGYAEPFFGFTLTSSQYGIVWSGLGLMHLILAFFLDPIQERYAHGIYLGGYALAAFAMAWTADNIAIFLWTFGILILVAIGSAFMAHFDRHYTWDDFVAILFRDSKGILRNTVRAAFIWITAWLSPIWIVLLLFFIGVPPGFQWLGFSFSALAFIGMAVWTRRLDSTYAWAFQSAAQVYTAAALLISLPSTIGFLAGTLPISNAAMTIAAAIVIQVSAVVFYITWAATYRQRSFTYLSSWLSFFPYTLAWIALSSLSSTQFALPWIAWACLLLITGFALDRLPVRFAHGPYSAGYLLTIFALAWSIPDRLTNLYVLAASILIALLSHLAVHFGRHHTWEDFVALLFKDALGTLRSTVRGAFIWITAWLSPIWIVLLLFYIGVPPGFQWLGFSLSAVVFIGLAIWTRRLDSTYAWAFQSAAQVYTAAALLISLPSTIGFLAGNLPISNAAMTIAAAIAIQVSAVVFYITWAATYQQRSFTYLSSWLSFFPYTLAWIALSSLSSTQFALPWIAWTCLLLITGFALDRMPVRFAHGPYSAGYLLMIFALAWSIPDRLTNLYVLAASILIALLSHLFVHFGRHHTWDDFIKFIWSKPGTLPRRVAQISFLNFAVYAFPVWLMLLLSYHQVSWAWRGLALALVAPLYIAFGLALRRIKVEYTWPLFSAGYALTAIGALVSIDDLSLAIYVLGLNTVVYAASAYIFRQPTWLYLSNTLIPIISLMTLQHNNQLIANRVSTIFMVLAFLYFGFGLWLDNRIQGVIKGKQISSYGLPFYSLCYLLSAISLAVASTERNLAIIIYAAGVALYGLSAWTFRVNLFIYPAAWLAAIPYYLVMTILIPETVWYGLGWLPMIIAYILFGRFAFKEKMKLSPISAALEHPATPFYLLAYALSISMIVLSAGDSLILTLALTAGTGVYILSTIIFQSSLWLYPSLITAHLALLSYFNIHPSGRPSYYISLPFLIVTWLMALIGYFTSRHRIHHRYRDEEQKIRLIDRIPTITYLRTRTWGQPFLIFATLDLIIWQSVAILGFDTAIIVSLSFAILLGLFSMLWFDKWLSYGSLALTLTAFGVRLAGANIHLSEALAWVGGFGLLIYLIRWLIEQILQVTHSINHPLAVWLSSLYYGSLFLTTLSAVGTLPFMFSHTTACAAALAFAGATYLAVALRGRRIRLSYLGSGMLLAAWVMALIFQDVNQPQLYAIPFGLYLASIGYFERQLGRNRFGNFVECFGFSVMLITSFIQSLNGLAGLPYFVLLMAESLGIFWWGAVQHCKIPLFIGISGSVINVVAQVIILVNVYQVSRWFVTLGVGLVLVVIGVIVERKRERILTRTREWREALEAWN